ncbi:hypothetical protein GQR58_018773 [Nymphon striatum]|nr:hypothetical protein GQR58_018773 [Nymphon striatum]
MTTNMRSSDDGKALVFLGSPSDGNLQRSDVLLKIGLADCSQLSHEQATHLVKNSGNHLNLTLSRPQSGFSSPGSSLPTTPVSPGPRSHPLSGPVKPTMYARPLPQSNITPPRQAQPPPSLFKTEMSPTPIKNWAASEFIAKKMAETEQDAIVNQTYRTNQLVLPGAKARHDLPTGSYLRHTKDPSSRKVSHQTFLSQPAMNKISDALMLSKPGADSHVYKSQVQQSLMGKDAPTQAKMRESMSPAPDGIILSNKTKVCHRQYNTPINMYSTQSVGDTLAGQGGFNQ